MQAARQDAAVGAWMWRELLIESLVRPREAARRVLSLGLGPSELIQGAVAVTCAGLVLGYFALWLNPTVVDPVSAAVLVNPLAGAAVQLAALGFLALLTAGVGRLFGGTGTAAGAFALVVWLNALMALIQAVHLVMLVLLPPLAGIVALGTLFWTFWAYVGFVSELHGFENPFFVLGGVILTLVALFFATAILFAAIGLAPPEMQ